MIQQAPRLNLRAWLEKQALPQEHGTYLVRDGRRIYEIDAATKRRWVAFRVAAAWLTLTPALLFIAVLLVSGSLGLTVILSSAAGLVLALLYYIVCFSILRTGERVPEERWKGPRIVDQRALFLRARTEMRISWVPVGIVVVACLAALLSDRPGAVTDVLPLLLLVAAYLIISVVQRRLDRRRAALIDGSEEDIEKLAASHRATLAILLAPAATLLLVVEIEWLGFGEFVGGVGAFCWLLVACYALSYTLGMPLYLLARRRGWRGLGAYVVGAFVMGAAAFPALVAIMALSSSATLAGAFGVGGSDWLFGLSVTGVLAMPIGLLFWLIARPDRSA